MKAAGGVVLEDIPVPVAVDMVMELCVAAQTGLEFATRYHDWLKRLFWEREFLMAAMTRTKVSTSFAT